MKKALIVLSVVVVLLAGYTLNLGSAVHKMRTYAGGLIHNIQESFDAGIAVNGTERITSAGAFKALTLAIGGGTAFDYAQCSSATTWNPAAVSTTSPATLDVALSGYVFGDQLIATLATSTRGLQISVSGTSTATTTVQLTQPDLDAGPAVDITTTTVQVCNLST